jgi:hypothetical protein
MKLINFFNRNRILLAAGLVAFTFASCDERKGSTYEGAENVEETADDSWNNTNQTQGEYTEEGDLETTPVSDVEVEYDYETEYTWEDRPIVESKLRSEIDRVDRSLERMGEDMEAGAESGVAKTEQEWQESKQALERERERLNTNLQEVENATEENWDQVRNDVNTSLQEFEQEWEKLDDWDVDVDVNRTPENGQ